ncbi:MAG: hypothetical protein DHS20C03_14560 [Minwuia thermotolerans]|nr:MAG: hypothetical protein DHS20C03_14560 [Minwuia thermotolerans]
MPVSDAGAALLGHRIKSGDCVGWVDQKDTNLGILKDVSAGLDPAAQGCRKDAE